MRRDTKNGLLSGVCAGLAKESGGDLSIIRVGLLLLTLFTGVYPGIIMYIIFTVVIRNEEGNSILEDFITIVERDRMKRKIEKGEAVDPEIVKEKENKDEQ